MSAFPKHQHNIECRYRHQRQQHTRIGLLESELASGVRYRAQRGILQQNHHLSQRRWFESALALERRNKLFERKILVGKRREGRRTNPTRNLTRTGFAATSGAE